jgi:pyruvate dehydrogenase E2 component (dihydrolipoamide acetyltransferase)
VADFTLPELGESVTSGDVLKVLVKPGDMVAKEQTVLELETDKATIEVPSSVAGRVTTVAVKPGDKVQVGQVVLSVEDGAQPQEAGDGDGARAATAPEDAEQEGAPRDDEKQEERQPAATRAPAEAVETDAASEVPDGGLEQHVAGPRRAAAPGGKDKPGKKEKADPPASPESAEQDGGKPTGRAHPSAAAPAGNKVVAISRGTRPSAEPVAPEMPAAPAAPSVRRMARELGVAIDTVPGSGAEGRISIEDVKAHARQLLEGAAEGGALAASAPLPDFARWGEVERQPMRALRRKTAEHLSVAWATIPHVTQHDLADITALEELRKKYAGEAEAAGGNLTVTAIAVKVVAAALKAFPQFNASVDLAAREIVHKKYVNIGVAVDTDRGLLVPVVRDADAKNIIQIAVEIGELSGKARAGKLSLEEMQGGCFSISNLGGIGGTYFTPIVNAPEVAVLGISRARMEPVYQDTQFVPRLMLPLSLSYDHRAVDGADGIRFLRWIVQALEQPFLLALQG